MIDTIAIIVISAILLYGWFISNRTKDYLNPVMSFIVPIAIGYVFFLIFYRNKCSEKTILLYVLGILSFTLGFVLHRLIRPYRLKYTVLNKNVGVSAIRITNHFLLLFKVITIVAIILNLIYTIRIAFAGPYGSNIIRNIRYMSNYVGGKGFIAEYSMVVVRVLLCILLYQFFVEENKRNKRWIIICTIAVFIGIVSTVARTQILSLAIVWYYIYSISKIAKNETTGIITWKKIKERWYIVLAIIGIIFVFYYFALQTNKLGGVEFKDSNFFINSYFGRELLNFDTYVKDYGDLGKGYYTFGWISKILDSLNIIDSPRVMEAIAVRAGGAVESFMRAPYIDFGGLGVCLVMFLIGYLNGFVYKQVLQKGGYWCLFYTTCIYSNVMAFFDYQYFMSGQVYFLVVLIVSGAIKTRIGEKEFT